MLKSSQGAQTGVTRLEVGARGASQEALEEGHSNQLKRGFRLFPSLYVVCGAALQGASAGPPIAVVPRHFEGLDRL